MYRNLRHCQDCDQLKAQPQGQAVCGFNFNGQALHMHLVVSRTGQHARLAACAYTLSNGESSTQSPKIAAHTPGLPRRSFSRTPPQCWDCPYYAGQAQKDHTRSCALGRRQHWYWGPGDNLVIQAVQAPCEPLFPHIDALREGLDRDTGELSPEYVEALHWFQDHPQTPVQAPSPTHGNRSALGSVSSQSQSQSQNQNLGPRHSARADRTPSNPFPRRTGAKTRTPDSPATP